MGIIAMLLDSLKPDIDRDVLLKLYDAAILEYRFNVQLGWDREKSFLTLVAALIAAGVGLISFSSNNLPGSIFLGAYFVACLSITYYAMRTVKTSKQYHREASYKKTLIERELGLLRQIHPFSNSEANFSISVTKGQQKHIDILMRRADLTKLNSGTIKSSIRLLFVIFMCVELVGLATSLYLVGKNAVIVYHPLMIPCLLFLAPTGCAVWQYLAISYKD